MGYKEIGLCRTEHMFFTNGNLDLIRGYTIAEEDAEKKKILGELKRKQEKAFEEILEAAGENKIRIRLLNCSPDRFLPSEREIEYLKRRLQEEKISITKTEVSTKLTKREGKIGDKIVINKNGICYGFTCPGSEGEIIKVSDSEYAIKFTKLTGDQHELPVTFGIQKDHVDIVSIEEMGYFEIFKTVMTLAYENESNKVNKKRNKMGLENMENRARRQKDVYDGKEMEDLYFMQVQAITEAYSRTGCKADIEILVPDFVPQNTKPQLQNQLQNITGGQKITINPNSSSVYFIKDAKTAIKEKERMQEAGYIVAPPKKVQSTQILLAQYAIGKGENKNESK